MFHQRDDLKASRRASVVFLIEVVLYEKLYACIASQYW